uniref:non-specific serine/threonine protein kinase n=1 Tax=Aegilops tauschii subsp. strangulata TaxID=200361 RepID=A0A453DPX3_AEGTS
MSKFLVAAVLLSLINHGADLATAWDDKDFFRYCPASKCSKHGPEIRFPFRLKSSNTSCSMTPCMELACSDQDTILVHPSLGRCKVTAIDYPNRHMYITPLVFYSSPCPLKKLFSRSIPIDAYAENQDSSGPISILPSDCKVCSDGVVPVRVSQLSQTRYNEEIHLKVEMFLKTYGTSKPTRYTFSEVKKMARRFKEKVGQGGFGTVYKGELANGVPVAVKLLENSTGEGGEFINEVATIGRIHHANIVQLLGFCSEGTRRALIYEFMPNDSLEKYIFSTDSNIYRQLLVPEKMLDVSLGIARGMEYLHQGCNQRILHFDIKPHNILLDYNFNPKISDFGLAKLCARDQSIVTLTAARGTMGYIAPELYSRNFGGISYKSDVYSFGMLVLEMVSGRRNLDPSVGSQNEVYLPEWIYEKVITGQELELSLEMAQEEKEKVRQLAIVGLWCIQWNPKNRPSMTKVVNMLTGRLQNLQIPPKPFISSGNHPVV